MTCCNVSWEMGPILWINAELVVLQHLVLSVEIFHSVYSRSTLIQGQPYEEAAPGGLGHFWVWDFLKHPTILFSHVFIFHISVLFNLYFVSLRHKYITVKKNFIRSITYCTSFTPRWQFISRILNCDHGWKRSIAGTQSSVFHPTNRYRGLLLSPWAYQKNNNNNNKKKQLTPYWCNAGAALSDRSKTELELRTRTPNSNSTPGIVCTLTSEYEGWLIGCSA